MKNLGGGKFVDVGMALGADDIRDSRGVAISDFDLDGDLDLVVNHNPGVKEAYREGIRPALLRNDVAIAKDRPKAPNRNWLAVDLEGGARENPTLANPGAIGAEVVITLADGTTMLRHVVAGSSYASQCSKRLHFGLGQHTRVERLVVRWKRPSNAETILGVVAANQLIKISQSATKNPIAVTNRGAE
jgi:hypothetical protein